MSDKYEIKQEIRSQINWVLVLMWIGFIITWLLIVVKD